MAVPGEAVGRPPTRAAYAACAASILLVALQALARLWPALGVGVGGGGAMAVLGHGHAGEHGAAAEALKLEVGPLREAVAKGGGELRRANAELAAELARLRAALGLPAGDDDDSSLGKRRRRGAGGLDGSGGGGGGGDGKVDVESFKRTCLLPNARFPSEFSRPRDFMERPPPGAKSAGSTLNGTKAAPRTLVVIMGQLRGGMVTQESAVRHLVSPLGADLALLGPFGDPEYAATANQRLESSALVRRAKYVWPLPETADWGDYLNTVPQDGGQSAHGRWRDGCVLGNSGGTFLGGVRRCQPGSSGILLFYRFTLQSQLQSLFATGGPDADYEWIVVTRGDYLYVCDVFDLAPLKPGVYLPFGQSYTGYTDRFSVLHRDFALQALNVTGLALGDADFLRRLFCEGSNLENAIARTLAHYDIPRKVFRHFGFTVREPTDPGRWTKGDLKRTSSRLKAYGLLEKYPEERQEAIVGCGFQAGPWNRDRGQADTDAGAGAGAGANADAERLLLDHVDELADHAHVARLTDEQQQALFAHLINKRKRKRKPEPKSEPDG